ncbi:hypothetical protein CS022_22685 [Veronia nyctiphanis]|uniref:Bro-N domain-containing protein n=1 Tax=Veronia nyctiphanis TaxID=1278244 RepID=A0A4Q0YKY5_9GAMM|nr:hypothetical protein [Veronia nyctiphanis]RXJ70674.1 hypothetical protein CS022_22685 [Veronia nyctiphanis]
MGSDDSKAGRNFQRWLYHEVVPSIFKKGEYHLDNNVTASRTSDTRKKHSSALVEMAEIIAQNSRIMADAIAEQQVIKDEVTQVQIKVSDVENRLLNIEGRNNTEPDFISISDWCHENNHQVTQEEHDLIVTWCANLSYKNQVKIIPCNSRNKSNSKFHCTVISEALSLIERSKV